VNPLKTAPNPQKAKQQKPEKTTATTTTTTNNNNNIIIIEDFTNLRFISESLKFLSTISPQPQTSEPSNARPSAYCASL